ncbi:site-2 protease family protein [Clavibacter tessellarius]
MDGVFLYILGVLIIVVGVAVSIGLHEVGHLVPAKLFGVRVTQYMIGFGPTIFSRRKGETEYGVKAIPLGGYISMIGMFPPQSLACRREQHGAGAARRIRPPSRRPRGARRRRRIPARRRPRRPRLLRQPRAGRAPGERRERRRRGGPRLLQAAGAEAHGHHAGRPGHELPPRGCAVRRGALRLRRHPAHHHGRPGQRVHRPRRIRRLGRSRHLPRRRPRGPGCGGRPPARRHRRQHRRHARHRVGPGHEHRARVRRPRASTWSSTAAARVRRSRSRPSSPSRPSSGPAAPPRSTSRAARSRSRWASSASRPRRPCSSSRCRLPSPPRARTWPRWATSS